VRKRINRQSHNYTRIYIVKSGIVFSPDYDRTSFAIVPLSFAIF